MFVVGPAEFRGLFRRQGSGIGEADSEIPHPRQRIARLVRTAIEIKLAAFVLFPTARDVYGRKIQAVTHGIAARPVGVDVVCRSSFAVSSDSPGRQPRRRQGTAGKQGHCW